MHCERCGREESCIHQVQYNEKDQLFLMLLVTALPAILYGIYFNIYLDFSVINYLEVGSIAISVSLVILLIAYYVFDKLYIVIFFGCHQRIERSIQLFNKPFILCARCTGIMIGMFATYFVSLFEFSYWWLLLGSIPMIIDGTVQAKSKYRSNNIKRFITGFLTGPSVVLLFGFLHFLLSRFIIELVVNILN